MREPNGNSTGITRRRFMGAMCSVAGVGALPAAPWFMLTATEGSVQPATGGSDPRVLVVVQLNGGNDALNMVVPYGDDAYYRARPTLGLPRDRVLPLSDYVGLNDRMAALRSLYDSGEVAIVQGVGYSNPARSHFRSMEIWETASDADERQAEGWLGRYFEHARAGAAVSEVGVALGRSRPQAFDSPRNLGIAFGRSGRARVRGADPRAAESRCVPLDARGQTGNGTLDCFGPTASPAVLTSSRLLAAAKAGGLVDSASSGDPLQMVAQLMRGGLAARVYYVSFGGFDTHANQAAQHDNLLGLVSESLAAFQRTLRRDGLVDRTLTLVFSEFGRRVAENASRGTDHGAAAPMVLVGSRVAAGLHGAHPSLTELDGGDLRQSVDFRSVYATVLQTWLGAEPAAILRRAYPTLPLIV